MGKIVKIEDLVYKTDKYVHNFQQYEIIRSFSKSIFARKISLDDSDKTQIDLLNEFVDLKKRAKLKDIEKRKL